MEERPPPELVGARQVRPDNPRRDRYEKRDVLGDCDDQVIAAVSLSGSCRLACRFRAVEIGPGRVPGAVALGGRRDPPGGRVQRTEAVTTWLGAHRRPRPLAGPDAHLRRSRPSSGRRTGTGSRRCRDRHRRDRSQCTDAHKVPGRATAWTKWMTCSTRLSRTSGPDR